MTPRRTHARPLRPAPNATPIPTFLGNMIAIHAGPLSIDLLDRNLPTAGHVMALSCAIIDRDDARSREVALRLAQMDPGHPDAVQLIQMLDVKALN